MLSQLRKNRESGFTLIELLTVIIIIGVLAAIAIPVFASQRSRAQDTQTVSDVRNIVTAAETYLADRTKNAGDITGQSALDYASSKNVKWDIKGNATTGGYCIAAFNESGKDYKSTSTLLTYDSTAGGLKKVGGSCGAAATGGSTGTNGTVTPTPTTSSAGGSSAGGVVNVASLTVVGSQNFVNTSSGPNGSRQTYNVPTTGVYKIEAWGAQGGTTGFSGGTRSGYSGAYTVGYFNLTAGQTLNLVVGQAGSSYTNAGWSGSNGSFGAGGGGGGSFVVRNGTPLMISSGGFSYNANGSQISISTVNTPPTNTSSSMAAGFYNDGFNYNSGEQVARSWANGSVGSGSTGTGGGGAGGYGGGGVGTGSGYGAPGSSNGDGTSYVDSTSLQTSIAQSTQTGHGRILISQMS